MIVSDFNPDAAADAVQGGFDDPLKVRDCDANTFHGFLGIEMCVVGHTDYEADTLLSGLASPQVQAAAVAETTVTNTPKIIDLSNYVTPVPAGGALLYQLPFGTTSLGGTVSLAGPNVTYTPPLNFAGTTTDTFVYVVEQFNGGRSHNVVKVTIN